MAVVLITGARGKTGREVARQLEQTPVTVRAGSSRPGNATVHFDWDDPATWPAAVDGADAIYLMRPDLPAAPDLVGQLVKLNPDAHIVLLSEQRAELQDWAGQVEEAVTSQAAGWTLLRPSWFQQVLTDPRFYRDRIRADGVLSLASGGAPIAWIDTRDIAAVAVAALLAPGDHHGRTYTLTGPEALTVQAVADQLSQRLGRPVRAVDPDPQEEIRDLDPWLAGILTDLYSRVRRSDFAEVTTTVEQITGRPPTPMSAFIDAHLAEWRR
ncbi:hypothetical protein AB0F81_03660 [Actinoplanes sp. NPDC024001]|uniref:hypothetical protein n=1 Tax=Actinoplanes sp. NPDC024001 TaxID=3154598 RepID=UPI0033C626D0